MPQNKMHMEKSLPYFKIFTGSHLQATQSVAVSGEKAKIRGCWGGAYTMIPGPPLGDTRYPTVFSPSHILYGNHKMTCSTFFKVEKNMLVCV